MSDPAAGNIVPSLRDISYQVFLDEIICNARPATAQLVRQSTNVWEAVTKYQNDLRKSCTAQLNGRFFTKNGTTLLDACAVLDCVLDEDFTDLEIDIPYLTIRSLSTLMSVIAHRSPKLKSLQITFYTISGISPLLEPPPRKVDCSEPSNSINTLKSLTSLSLHHRDTGVDGFPLSSVDEPYESIFGIIAKYCPVLTDLSVRGLRLRVKRDLLELLLGDYVTGQLSPMDNTLWSNTFVLSCVRRVPQEFFIPLCSTLQKIELSCLCFTYNHCACSNSLFKHSVIPFASLNLPQLQSLLWENFSQHRWFKKHTEAVTALVGERNFIGFPTYLSGIFSRIKSLEIPVDDIEMMREVGSFCPELKYIRFSGSFSYRYGNITQMGKININYHTDISHHPLLADSAIDSILNNWPKVKSISFLSVI